MQDIIFITACLSMAIAGLFILAAVFARVYAYVKMRRMEIEWRKEDTEIDLLGPDHYTVRR